MLIRHKALPVLLLLLAVAPAGSQAPESQQPPILRRTARLVEVSIVAQDAAGKSVAGLTKDDFEVFDENTPQQISVFVADSRAVQPAVGAKSEKNTFTNRMEHRGSIPTSVSIILLDALNTRRADMAGAREQVFRFLATLRQDDRVALYALDRNLVQLHDFTGDSMSLRRAVQTFRGGHATELAASRPAPPETVSTGNDRQSQEYVQSTLRWLEAVQGRMANYMVQDRVYRTTAALEAIGNHLSNVAGRKNLIWISSGFPLNFGMASNMTDIWLAPERTRYVADVERSIRALNNAGLVIYPIEARGVFDAVNEDPNLYHSRPHYSPSDAPPVPDTKVDTSDRDAMLMLADRTGGKAYYNTNDLAGAIRNAVDDSAGSYTIGYYPSHNQWLGQWRKIKVRVKRLGIKLRHRPGYYALKEPAPATTERYDLTLAAASSPLEATALGLTARTEYTDASHTMLKLQIEVDSQSLLLQRQQGNQFSGAFDVSFAQFDREGKRLRYVTQSVDMKLSSRTLSAMHQEGLEIAQQLQLVPGATEVRVAVRDATNGLTGSVSIPLQQVVPSPG